MQRSSIQSSSGCRTADYHLSRVSERQALSQRDHGGVMQSDCACSLPAVCILDVVKSDWSVARILGSNQPHHTTALGFCLPFTSIHHLFASACDPVTFPTDVQSHMRLFNSARNRRRLCELPPRPFMMVHSLVRCE